MDGAEIFMKTPAHHNILIHLIDIHCKGEQQVEFLFCIGVVIEAIDDATEAAFHKDFFEGVKVGGNGDVNSAKFED